MCSPMLYYCSITMLPESQRSLYVALRAHPEPQQKGLLRVTDAVIVNIVSDTFVFP